MAAASANAAASQPLDSWRLIGTVITPQHSTAIFQDKQATERRIMAGETLAGCTLKRVVAKHVDLICKDSNKVLRLQEGESAGIAAAHHIEDRNIALQRDWLYELVADRQRLVNQISLVPEVIDGAMYGYRVAKMRPGSDVERLGLLTDDVITAVNGTPASQPTTFMQTVNSLRGVRVITLDVQREGQTLSLNFLLD